MPDWEIFKRPRMKFFKDIQTTRQNDPAAKRLQFLLYPSIHAIFFHRYLNRPLYLMKLHFFARLFSQTTRFFTGIEIHPGAKIDAGFFCDHGMGTVIGETSIIGKNCIMFHGVTLGGTGKHGQKRHPTIGDNVFIGTHATLLGPIEVGDNAKIGAETVIINRDVPANSTVVGAPGKIVKIGEKKIDPPAPLPVSRYRVIEKEDEHKNYQENGQEA